MRRIYHLISTAVLMSLVISSCSSDNKENLFPELSLCDTLEVSYSNDILPVMVNNCYSCHSTSSDQTGIILEGHTNLSAYANSGVLLGVIKHDEGYPQMPFNSDQLDNCSIEKFEAWINQGAPNN